MRLDLFLVKNSIASGRDRAKEMILSGHILVNGTPVLRPSTEVLPTDTITSTDNSPSFVGRGGDKLLGAINAFGISVCDKVCIDVGASTGGFTDCMLSLGAKYVYAVDVGHGQLAKKLIDDERVANLEKTDIRTLTDESITQAIDFFSVDVSFISLTHIFPAVNRLTKPDATGVFLIKPQFETGPCKALKKGVIKDKKAHIQVITRVLEDAFANGFSPVGLTHSPICGQNGNIEFLLYVKKGAEGFYAPDILSVVDTAHKTLYAK